MNRENTHERERGDRKKEEDERKRKERYIHCSYKNINERFYSNKEKKLLDKYLSLK
jgi:hypothetical protein